VAAKLEHFDESVVFGAVRALECLGPEAAAPHVKTLARCLRHSDPTVRATVLSLLGSMGKHAAKHSAEIAATLDDKDSDVRLMGLDALGQLGALAAEHIGKVAARAQSGRSEEIRAKAIEVLSRFGKHAAPHIGILIGALSDPCLEPRRAAMGTLSWLKRFMTPADAAAVASMLTSPRADVAFGAMSVLAVLDKRHLLPLADTLASVIADGSSQPQQLQRLAIEALEKLGNDALPHINTLVGSLSGLTMVSIYAGQTLVRLSGLRGCAYHREAAARDVAQMLAADCVDLKLAGVRCLGLLGRHAAAAAQEVARCLHEVEWDVLRAAAVETLGKIIGGSEQATRDALVQALRARLTDHNCNVRQKAHAALRNLGEKTERRAYVGPTRKPQTSRDLFMPNW